MSSGPAVDLFADLAAVVGWGTAIQILEEPAEIKLIIEPQLVSDFLHLEIGVDHEGKRFLIDSAGDVFFRTDSGTAGKSQGKRIHGHTVSLCQRGDADVSPELALDQIEDLGKLHVGGKMAGHDSIQFWDRESDPRQEISAESQQFRNSEFRVGGYPLLPLGNIK